MSLSSYQLTQLAMGAGLGLVYNVLSERYIEPKVDTNWIDITSYTGMSDMDVIAGCAPLALRYTGVGAEFITQSFAVGWLGSFLLSPWGAGRIPPSFMSK